MAKYGSYILFLTSLFFVFGCVRYESHPGSVVIQKLRVTDLDGKTLNEVLSLKYKKAQMNCRLWTQFAPELDLSGAPNDAVSFDLKTAPYPESLTLKAEIPQHRIQLQIQIHSVELQKDINLIDEDGSKRHLTYTPFVNVNFIENSYSYEGLPDDGAFIVGPTSGSSVDLYEQHKYVPVNSSVGPRDVRSTDKNAFHDYVGCTVETEINSEYQAL